MLPTHSKKVVHIIAAITYAFLFTEVWDAYIKQQLVSLSWPESTISTIFSLSLVIPMFAIASYAISPDRTDK